MGEGMELPEPEGKPLTKQDDGQFAPEPHSTAAEESATEKMLIGADALEPQDWELVIRLVANRAREFNQTHDVNIDLEELLRAAQGDRS